MGVWISWNGIGWAIDPYAERLLFAKEYRILGNVLISHDEGWYDLSKERGVNF